MSKPCCLSLVVILTVVGFTTAAVVPSPKVTEDKEADPILVKVTQHIHVSRKRRSIDDVKAGMEYFDFPEFMRFSFDFNDRHIDLNLTRCTYVNMDMNFHFSNRVSKHDFSDRFAMYRSVKQLAAVLVECNPSHCHLYGSVDIDGLTYSIESDRETLKGHILRKREPVNIEEFSKAMYANKNDESSSTAVAKRRVRRSTATFHPECDVFEIQLLLDNTIWDFYMMKNDHDENLAREEIWKYYTAVLGEVNLRFACIVDYISKFCDDLECEINCLRAMLTGIEIEEDSSWTDFDNMRFDFTFKDGTTSTFVDGWKALKRCGKIHKSKPNQDDWDIYMCLTRYDIAVKKRDRKFYAYFRTYTWVPSICQSDRKYPTVVSESIGDGLDIQFVQNLLHSLGVGRDDSCDRIWVMKEDIDSPVYDPAAHGISWNIKKCALKTICDKIHELNNGDNCLRDHHFSQNDWDDFYHNTSTLFGEIFSANDQCKDKWGPDSVQCDPDGNGNLFPDHMCSTFIFCNTSDGCVCPVRVMSGTPCGFARYCFKGQCIPIPDRENGEDCDCHSQCTTPNAHCDERNFTCVCDDGFEDDNGDDVIGGNCTEKTPNGGDCETDCLDCNAICVNGSCVCAPGYYDNDGTCDLQVCLGEPCFETLQCFGENVNCSDQGICVCDFGYFVNDVGQCILYNGTLCDPCTQEPDSCTQENTACGDGGFCECAGDTVEYDGVCYGTNYGENCTTDLDTCSDDDNVCGENGICVCVEGYTFVDGICVGSEICEPCINSSDTCGSGLECSDLGYCVCEEGTVQIGNGCYGTHFGETCTTYLDTCSDDDNVCGGDGICVCVEGYTFVDGVCVGSEICDPCVNSSDACGSGLECGDLGYCVCEEGTVQIGNGCYGTHYGETCTAYLDTCSDDDNVCGGDGICVCVEGYTFVDGVCVGSDICDPCVNSPDTCGSGLECGDLGYCVCEEGTVQIGNGCYGTHFGETCTTYLDTCSDDDNVCGGDGICVCVEGYAFVDGVCVGSEICDPCVNSSDTCGSGLECGDLGYCVCEEGTVQIGNGCYGTHFGETCTTYLDTCSDDDNECGGDGICVCVEGYTFVDGVCVGSDICDPCIDSSDTCGSGLECGDLGYCVCEEGTVQIGNGCYGTHYGETCTTYLDTCSDVDNVCGGDGICVCVEGYSFVDGFCVGSEICDPCVNSSDTCGSGLECGDLGYCVCEEGTVQIGNKCYGKYYGQDCTEDCDTCVGDHAECIDGICSCDCGFTYDGSICVGSDYCDPCNNGTCAGDLVCGDTGVCGCPFGQYFIGSACISNDTDTGMDGEMYDGYLVE